MGIIKNPIVSDGPNTPTHYNDNFHEKGNNKLSFEAPQICNNAIVGADSKVEKVPTVSGNGTKKKEMICALFNLPNA